MNLANKLTLSRIAVLPFFLVTMSPIYFWGWIWWVAGNLFSISIHPPESWVPSMHILALLIFVCASLTDYYDGKLARRRGWVTTFGSLMDPLADKILVMAAFVSLVEMEIFPAWMVIIILAREFLITGLRQLASTHDRVLSADRWGKNKTISQMVTIITALTYLAARDWLKVAGLWDADIMRRWEISWVLTSILHLMMLLCVILTILSGWRYCVINYNLLDDN